MVLPLPPLVAAGVDADGRRGGNGMVPGAGAGALIVRVAVSFGDEAAAGNGDD